MKPPKTPKLSPTRSTAVDNHFISPYNNPNHFNHLGSSSKRYTPTSSPNQDIQQQQQLYTHIHPPATPKIFTIATKSLSYARSCQEFTEDDVFSSPLPLAPSNKAKKRSNLKQSDDDTETDRIISSPTYNKLNEFSLKSETELVEGLVEGGLEESEKKGEKGEELGLEPTEPWKQINYSLFAEIPVDESMF
ncbi:hypothetical protein E3P92_03628 [Wallemia ichthyophaga]|nr:hypothetical protein E3P92_03628 [Wallemia ichthyophaga]TIB29495.1 hypothetical protein E3P84_03686 [Wallemia ichthyophaga]TIB39120.1 hypothetical protein E3P83_03658 [Wallemia ichthyophaga]